MAEEYADVNEHVRDQWKAATTPFERVQEIVEATREPESAAEIADRALVSEPTARRHCEALVNAGYAIAEQDGQATRYRRNPDHVLTTRIQELRRETSRAELLDSIEEMKGQIRAWQDEYDVLSPEELASELDGANTAGWNVLAEWRSTRRNLSIAQAALAYDDASEHLPA